MSYPDPDGSGPKVQQGPDYTYTPGGRLKTRTWARVGTGGQRIVTRYKYGFDDGVADNDHGGLLSVAYENDPANTLGIAYDYDRHGRQKTVTQGDPPTQDENATSLKRGQKRDKSETGSHLNIQHLVNPIYAAIF